MDENQVRTHELSEGKVFHENIDKNHMVGENKIYRVQVKQLRKRF
jgi:hypothetical protein